MDEIDKKILIELVQNSKIPISQLAKKIKVSRDIASYRLNKLKSTGIIRDYITEIDINKLGYKSALLFIIIDFLHTILQQSVQNVFELCRLLLFPFVVFKILSTYKKIVNEY